MDESNVIIISDTLSIPTSELSFRFSPSRGPGGQHVNRAHTRVTLIFDVADSPSLDEETRARLLDGLAGRLDKRGILQLTVQDSRRQSSNRQLAISRFAGLLAEALSEEAERVPSRPSPQAAAGRVQEKRRRGRRKGERGKNWFQDT